MKICLCFGSGYFASRGKIAPCYFAIWWQNSPNGYFAASAKLAPILTQTLTQEEEKHYFASRGKIATFLCFFLELCLVLVVVNRVWLFTGGSGADLDLKIEKMADPDRIRISSCWIRSGSGSLNLWIRPHLLRIRFIGIMT